MMAKIYLLDTNVYQVNIEPLLLLLIYLKPILEVSLKLSAVTECPLAIGSIADTHFKM